MTTTSAPMKVRNSITAKLLKWTPNARGGSFSIITGDHLVTNTYWCLTEAHPLWAKLTAKFPHDGEGPSTKYTGTSANKFTRWDESGISIERTIPDNDGRDLAWEPIERGEPVTRPDLGLEDRPFAYIVERPSSNDRRRKHQVLDALGLDANLIELIASEDAVIECQADRKKMHGPWRVSHDGIVVGWVMPIRLN